MAKKHSSLITSDLHHPKGILVESTDAMLVMSQSINTATASFHFIPGDSDTYTLGNAGRPWKELYVSTSSIHFMDKTGNTVQTMTATPDGITFASGSLVSDLSGSVLSGSKLHIVGDAFIGGDLTLGDADTDSISIGADITSNLTPNANATYDLGSATKGWNDLHLGAAGVINWANGGITLTETSDVLVQSGGNLRVPRLEIDSAADYVDVDTDLKIIAAADIILDPGGNNVLPGSDDADDLGASGTQWKDLYIDGVAYIDTLNADALGANLDHGNFNSTNVDIDSGAIDGTAIGAASATTIKGTTIDATTDFTIDGLVLTADTITNDANLTMDLAGDLAIDVDGGDVVITDDGADILTINATTISGSATSSGSFAHIAVNSVSASRIELDNIQGNWTNAGNTVADLGSITTADINGGTVDGATIGASSHTTIKGTTIDATADFTIGGTVITDNTITDDGTLVIASTTATSFSDGNITNVGDIALDTISADDGSSLSFSNNWTNAGRTVADLGIVTTVDINGGSIDGTTIGAASAVAGTFAAIVGTTIDATTDFTIGSTVITDDSIVMTPSTSDTITFSGATNGALAITTVDDAAAAANITITADGTFEAIGTTVTLDSGGAINLEPAAGSAILLDGTISVDAGVVTGATSITSTDLIGTNVDGILGADTARAITGTTIDATTDFTIGSTVITDDSIVMTPTSGDTATIAASTNGALTITTVDTAAAAANLLFTVDGTAEIASAGLITLDSGAAINIEPAAGSAILLDGTISIDAGVVTGATSITSTAFVGTSDGVVGGNTPAAGTFTTLVATGNVDLGDATGDTITATGRFDSDIVPSTNSARDLGTSALQFAEAHIDTGHIDAITATGTSTLTTVDINGGNIDGTVIGAATPASGSFTGIIVTGGMEVRGDLTYVSSSNLDIGDRIVTLNAGSAAGDGGLYINDADTTETGSLLWDVSEDRWIGGLKDAEVNLVTISSTDTLTNKTLTSPDINTPDIDGGTIDNTVIGAATQAAGDFTAIGAVAAGTIVGTTIDATTDFTIGTTVITDDSIVMTPSTDDTATIAASTNGALTFTTVDTAAAAANLLFTIDGTAEIASAGLITLDSGAAINIEPAAGSAILLDGTISIDAGVVTGATSITSTALAGELTGNSSTATALATGRTIAMTGDVAWTSPSFDGSGNVTAAGTIQANAVQTGMVHDDVATELAGAGTTATSGVINVIGGDGITANANDVAVTAAQTTITSIYNTGLKVGRDASGDWIDFGTDDNIKVYLSNVEEFRFTAGGTFHADADVVAYSSTVASDMNLKENITDMKYGLSDVMKLRGVEYDWKREDMGHDVGVLAQEVEAVIPELVKEHEGLHGRGKFKSVDYNKLVPVLIESIKELKKEIDDLKSN